MIEQERSKAFAEPDASPQTAQEAAPSDFLITTLHAALERLETSARAVGAAEERRQIEAFVGADGACRFPRLARAPARIGVTGGDDAVFVFAAAEADFMARAAQSSQPLH